MRSQRGLALVLSLLLPLSLTETVALNETVATSSPSTPLQWKSCRSYDDSETSIIFPTRTDSSATSKLIECATLTVPLCYDASCAKGRNMTHTLRLSRLATATAADAPTLWIAQDALLTSQSADELMTRITQHATSNANVYALESRLFSNVFTANYTSEKPTPCASMVSEYATRPLVDASFVAALAACRSWIDTTLGSGGITAYSLDSAARDLSLAMSTVQTQEKTASTTATYVYASGRATRVVQRMLSQSKATTASAAEAGTTTSSAVSVTGVVLDSPFPTPAAEKPVGDAMSRFVSACGVDSLCSTKFKGTSLAEVITQVYALVDGNSTAATLPSAFANSSACVTMLKTAALKDARDVTASHGVRRLLTKPTASATDTSVFADLNVLILASRLSTVGSGVAASQLHEALLSKKQSDHTLLMVQSDRLDEVTVATASDVLLRLLGQFLNGKTRGLSGAWLSRDLTSFAWSASPPSTNGTTSTLGTSTPVVNFTMSGHDSITWFAGFNAYEEFGYSDSELSDVWGVGGFFLTPIVIGAVVVVVVLLGCCWGRRRRAWKSPPPPPQAVGPSRLTPWPPQPEPAQRPASPIPMAVLVMSASAPDFPEDASQLFPPAPPSSSEPFGLQPQQWEANHANEYALSYTPRDSNTLITRL